LVVKMLLLVACAESLLRWAYKLAYLPYWVLAAAYSPSHGLYAVVLSMVLTALAVLIFTGKPRLAKSGCNLHQ
jgi:hypothetical protein